MTSAEFIAACFWPLVILFAVLLASIRDHVLRRSIAIAAVATGFLYLGLSFFYAQSSIVAVIDFYLFIGLFGCIFLAFGYNRLCSQRPGYPPKGLKEKLASYSAIFLGVSTVWISGSTLFSDFAQPRLVLEGRAENLRTMGRRRVDYLADISGQTVKATTPVYERLKFKPYVRVEVGRGSNYIYRIEYLSN
jgi:hypothetical protein